MTEGTHVELVSAIKNGSLPTAFALVNNQPIDRVLEWMLKAGFSTTGTRDKSQFWQEVQSNLSRACAARMDGYELRSLV
jgi:hypothetical protein